MFVFVLLVNMACFCGRARFPSTDVYLLIDGCYYFSFLCGWHGEALVNIAGETTKLFSSRYRHNHNQSMTFHASFFERVIDGYNPPREHSMVSVVISSKDNCH